MNFKKLQGEIVIKEGEASKRSIINSQSGQLTLTDKRLVFVGDGTNFGEASVVINTEDIMIFSKVSTSLIIFPIPVPNAFKIVTKQGKKYKFTVTGVKKWIAELNNVINSSN